MRQLSCSQDCGFFVIGGYYQIMVITIDGATGVGKSTIAKVIAQNLDFLYVSTGRIYRSLAYSILKDNPKLTLGEYIDILDLEFKDNILIANNITDEKILQNENIAYFATEIGANINYKKAISKKIVDTVYSKDIVVEGRMAGTLLFPNADFKVYLHASIEERVNRKLHQLEGSSYESLRKQLENRDALVNSVVGTNTFIIDTSNKTTNAVIKEIMNELDSALF